MQESVFAVDVSGLLHPISLLYRYVCLYVHVCVSICILYTVYSYVHVLWMYVCTNCICVHNIYIYIYICIGYSPGWRQLWAYNTREIIG